MSGLPSPRRDTIRWSRLVVLVAGVALMTVAFVGLVDEQLSIFHAAPWWYLGAVGIVAVLIGLGSPWEPGARGD